MIRYATLAPASPPAPPVTSADLPPSVAARMADILIEQAANGGGTSEEDLFRLGFTRAEIAAHAQEARTIAQRWTKACEAGCGWQERAAEAFACLAFLAVCAVWFAGWVELPGA